MILCLTIFTIKISLSSVDFYNKASVWKYILDKNNLDSNLQNYSIYNFYTDISSLSKPFIYPRHMCESILFRPGEDILFDSKYNRKGFIRYPNPVEHAKAWRKLIIFWLQGSTLSYKRNTNTNDQNKQRYWYWYRNKENGYFKLGYKPTNQEPNLDEWNNPILHPDNVFSRYNIDPRSNLIETIVNKNSDSELYEYRDASIRLLGFDMNGGRAWKFEEDINGGIPSVGGWLGFFRSWNKIPRKITPEQFLYGTPSITNVEKNVELIIDDINNIRTYDKFYQK